MKIVFSFAAALGIFAGCATSQSHFSESQFVSLFDGKTLNGWTHANKRGAEYYVTNGVLVCPKNSGRNLVTEKEYSDFVLRLDFKLQAGGNNGVAIRAPMQSGELTYTGNEIQILDDNAPEYAKLEAGQYCGSLYKAIAAKRGFTKPAGEWNSYEITAQGRHVKVVLNGHVILDGNINDIHDPKVLHTHPGLLRPKGHIGFLGHYSDVEFRNIRIHELPNYIERDNTDVPEGFAAMFNGRDLTGWKGLVADPIKRAKMSPQEMAKEQAKADEVMRDTWKVEDGAIAYHGHAFNNLCSATNYGDFELVMDWKMDPKADSGVYLRGSPQVQIWEPHSPAYDTKHPGSGGLYNNQKGINYPTKMADHFVGDWNRFRILLTGDKVHVFLNNELVVNNVTLENYWDRSRPLFATGPVELQAHNSVVYFKNIYIREIPKSESSTESH